MSYLIQQDYKKLIQVDNLSQIIGQDYSLLTYAEQSATEELTSYLRQKYDVSKEFTDTTQYSYGSTYKAKQRVYLDAIAYSATSTYAIGALVLYNAKVYFCSTPITVAEAWTVGHWTLLGNQYAMFYVTLPHEEWSMYTVYAVGDSVWYNDKVYTALYGGSAYTPSENPTIWGSGTSYTTNSTPINSVWTAGDNRNAKMKDVLIDIILHDLHSRISPMNIPALRVKRYDDAISWLKNCAKGDDITCTLPRIQPFQGNRLRMGSVYPKQNNNF